MSLDGSFLESFFHAVELMHTFLELHVRAQNYFMMDAQ